MPTDSPVTNATRWHLVLNRGGTVLASTDGAPASLVGTRLDNGDEIPEDLKEAGRTILGHATDVAAPLARVVFLESIQQSVHLTVLDALPLRRVPIDIRALLRSGLHTIHQQARASDVTLTVLVDDRVPPIVSLDADQIAWSITALVGNALRYVRRGSLMMPSGSIAVQVTYNSAGPEVTFEVRDDGPGIPADKLPFLFTAGAEYPRQAMGLWMVREVIAAHGGHLEVHSDSEAFLSGTTVRLTVPAW